MTATAQPQGLVPARHPSGIIRIENLVDGVANPYASNLFTGTPVMRGTDGTLQFTTGVAGACIGVFQGCEYTSGTKRFVIPYYPAGTTYEVGSMIAKFTADPDIIYEAQSVGPVTAADVGGAVNVSGASVIGNTYTGFSTQHVGAPTGATAGTFIIVGLSPYDDNAWGDAYTKILVQIATKQAAVAFGASADESRVKRAEDEAKKQEIWKARREEDDKRDTARREEDKRRDDERREEDKRREEEDKRIDEEAARRPDDERNRSPESSQLPADPTQGPWPAQPAQPAPFPGFQDPNQPR